MNDPTTTNEIKLEPNYEGIRARSAAEARLKADTLMADLLPETLIPVEYLKKVQLDVLRAFRSVLVPINTCIQAIDSTEAVIECRELVDAVSETIVAKAEDIEKAMAAEYVGDDFCRSCGRRGVGLFPMEDGFPMCGDCAGWIRPDKQ